MERDVDGSYRTPHMEHARVEDAARVGIFTCSAAASLREAARTMSLHHVHTVVVVDPADGSPLGIISDSGLVGAILDAGEPRSLGEIADRTLPMISSREPLRAAAEMMRDRGTAHLVVQDAETGRPTGMLSTLDVAGILAWGEA
jgi:CBS domain-containing protein